jgi:hypothetical protein
VLALNQLGCYRVTQEEPQTIIPSGRSVPMERVVGVTLKNGRDIQFDNNSNPIVRRDTIRVEVANQLLTIPVSDVQRVWVLSINKTPTVFVVLGFVVLALFLATVIAFQSLDFGP